MANIINPNELFTRVPDEKINFNDFSLSYDNVHTLDPGRINICSMFKVLPGQYLKVSCSDFIRTQPLLSPIFGKLDYFKHAFFVPFRVLSTNWEEYIRAGETGILDEDEDTEILEPDLLKIRPEDGADAVLVKPDSANLIGIDSQLTGYSYAGYVGDDDKENLFIRGIRPFFAHGGMADSVGIGSVAFNYVVGSDKKLFYDVDSNPDYLATLDFSLMPFKAYQACWCEYYADANVMTFDDMDTIQFDWLRPVHTVQVNGLSNPIVNYYIKGGTFAPQYSNSVVLKNLFRQRYRCYAKDYFTSALPEPQRGPDVLIPITDTEVKISNDFDSNEPTLVVESGSSRGIGVLGFDGSGQTPLQKGIIENNDFSALGNARLYNAKQLRAEISSLSATIVDLRTACALQEFYESNARYGNRYKEFIYGNFASMIPDNQLYRPWYLGGIKMPITIDEVLQTSTDQDSNLGVGNMYGKATTGGAGLLFERKFDDYGIVIILESIRPHNYYKTYHNRMWSVNDRLEEYWRKLQSVGEQALTYRELTGNFVGDLGLKTIDDTFGYQMRYSEYKQRIDEIHGDFKGNLSYWTIARDFSQGVELTPDFLQVYPGDIDHIFQYVGTDSDHFLINSSYNVIATLPMDIYSVPRIN